MADHGVHENSLDKRLFVRVVSLDAIEKAGKTGERIASAVSAYRAAYDEAVRRFPDDTVAANLFASDALCLLGNAETSSDDTAKWLAEEFDKHQKSVESEIETETERKFMEKATKGWKKRRARALAQPSATSAGESP